MEMMICENAKQCKKVKCPNKRSHKKETDCAIKCAHPKGIQGSKCILVNEAKLINHPKYCKFSNQPGSLCALKQSDGSCKDANGNLIREDWDCCPRKKQQVPVALVSPLDRLLDEAVDVMGEYVDVAFMKKDFRKMLEVFAKKVKELK